MDFFGLILTLHSLLRWLVLGAGILAFGLALRGWLGGRAWTATDDKAGRVWTLALDIQLLLGLLLYFISPYVRQAMGDMAAAMGDPALRFWSVEHAFMMLVALVFAHIGRARSRRAAEDSARHRQAAIWYGLALLLIFLAIPWPFRAAVGRPWLPF